VEKQTGTTELSKLGGLGRIMPFTFAGFTITAASISGVPPFNGFFSKELVYDGALERGFIFYLAALLGSFLTAASFLKLGHAAFLGKPSETSLKAKEAPLSIVLPILVLAGLCVLFGLWNSLPLHNLIQPVLSTARLAGHDFAGLPHSVVLVLATIVVIALAVLNHLWGLKKFGSGLHAVDHIHHAPILGAIYQKAEKRLFDPYEIALRLAERLAQALYGIDRFFDFVVDRAAPQITFFAGRRLSLLHNGSHARYLLWSLGGVAAILAALILNW
jgi:NADH-quinone oxidoreductase subunit L